MEFLKSALGYQRAGSTLVVKLDGTASDVFLVDDLNLRKLERGVISWPKLRRLLGVGRLSMPDADVARKATGYERGTITPLGSAKPWPVIADERVRGREITLGAGEHGLALAADADEILQALNASVADISDSEPAT